MEGEAEQPVKLTQGQYLAEMGVEALPRKGDPLLADLEARFEAECEKVRGLYVSRRATIDWFDRSWAGRAVD